MAPPSHVDPAEDLGRSVFSRSRSNRARRGQIDMDIFLEREDATSISVDRMVHAPIQELAEWSRDRGRNRNPPRTFYGWAVLTAENAGRSGRTVVATPLPENPCHADIFLNVSEDERRRQQKQHANELAAHAKWAEVASPAEENGA